MLNDSVSRFARSKMPPHSATQQQSTKKNQKETAGIKVFFFHES